ncbi:hypothetical protein REL05_014875 [Clostridioides difficile]|nr:hypothetical protein [Clostridioides difficile]MCI4282041.1 hypothetical protein [Clostridioides difficile]MCP3358864.1 hypothetical protein [Clostridioides difficile]MDS6200008.1 hypothetical protein [Clostridioides difficile]HBF8218551.1 hypothetical protein [Clostridioides difficile]
MMMDWNFWFSVVTAVIAVIALMQTKQQIKLSNKQHLFDKRVEHYLIAKGLIQLYESNRTLLIFKEDEPALAMDFIFAQMTNNTYLEKITDAIAHPLEQPYHKEFLIKMEILKEVSSKIKFIFGGKAAVLLGDYVLCYQELLFRMYQYQILLENMKKASQEFKLTIDKAQETVGEKHYREELKKATGNLKQAYDMFKKEKVEEKIEKQIKLK